MDNFLSPIPSTKDNPKTALNDGVSGLYHYELPSKNVPDSWCAFVNSNLFGIGIYSPNASWFNASRGRTTTNIAEKENQETNDNVYTGSQDGFIPSCYVSNYNYINTSIKVKMVDFIPLQFSYAVFAGEVDEMRDAFSLLKESGKMIKEELAWPIR